VKHVGDDDGVVAGVVLVADGALDPGHRALQSRPRRPVDPADIGEPVGALQGEAAGDLFVVAAHDVDAEPSGGSDGRPCG
jgi:hypothetical protein